MSNHKEQPKIQAAEACKWLRAAGFPQYAQMYEDHQFPIDLSSVKKDHSFLEPDSCKSLFRRLDTLNRCANIKVDSWRSNQDDSEDENQCALSQNWTFQPEQRRWSRTRNNEPLQPLQTISGLNTENIHDHSNTNSPSKKSLNSSRYDINLILDNEDISLSRSGSEKIKDGAKALLRRVESIKTRRRKKQNRDGMVIYKDGDILTINKTNNLSIPTLVLPKDNDSDNSSQYSPKILSPHSPVNSATLSPRRILHGTIFHARDDAPRRAFVNRRGSVSLDRRDTVEVMSDSEVQRRKSRDVEKLRRDGHLTVSDYDSDLDEHDITRECRNSWHSIQIGITHTYVEAGGLSLLSLTCGQLQVLRKLALLKLTGLIEKYCPTHKTGWNWELPKFIRKIKTPDYKSKAVFGVPLIVNLQRSGNPLPYAIQKAMNWLRKEAIDHVGLFRKSGVRSRIQALKTEVEKTNDFTLFDDQQSYDVADMIKQYFRELPEALLTTKLSETLILIFQHVPPAFRREAVSYVILLMPNEHCEVLQHILNFFQAITECSSENQMNASNLALCFAPSLFYYNQAATLSTNTRHNSVSPRRKKATGTPDTNDLNENKAAYECLLYLIKHQKTLFIVPKEMLMQCKFSDLDQSKPLPLAELGEHAGWKSYLEDCIHALQKEAKDRARGWINASGNGHNGEVELAYKKVGDGHPLRLWRVATEVEAPPQEVLHRVLHERHIWDSTLIKVQVVQQLDAQSEIYQYQCASMEPLASRDYCVLRTWKTDLPRGACAIVETSVDHKHANLGSNSIRAVVLASRYLIEPCGSGKSRLMHFSRIDLMGRTPEWYNKCYGHVCRLQLCEIRNSFKHSVSVGPESKV